MKAETLRKSILEYAIQGKLVPQIESEEPANMLFDKIKKEKQELIRQGKLKKSEPLPAITEDEMPYELPDSWGWVRFDDVANLFTGDSINAQEKQRRYTNLFEGYNYIATKDVRFDNSIDYENGIKIPFATDFKIARTNSTLLCIEGGSAGRKVGILNKDVCFGNKLCAFEPIIIDEFYLFYYLQAPSFTENFKNNKSGMIGGVGVNTIKTLFFALPPLAEQKRIVILIKELMAIVDEYEKNQIELSILEREFPEKLKRAILQYAIQGKLVMQIEKEEPTSLLLEKIKKEKHGALHRGQLRKEKLMPQMEEDDVPFYIPESWIWVRLQDLCIQDITYGIIKLGDEDKNGVKVLRCSDVKAGKIDKSNIRTVKKELSEQYSRTILAGGEIVVNVRGTLGGCALVPNDLAGYNIAREVAMVSLAKSINSHYIMLALLSPYFDKFVADSLRGIAYKGLNIELLKKFIVPLPPLAEQHRIVNCIEEVFNYIDMFTCGIKFTTKKIAPITELKSDSNVIPLSQKKTFDISSLKLAARQEENIDEETINNVLKQVQEYYDKKN